MIKNIFFDLDDTLLDFHQAERVALSKTLLEIGVNPTDCMLARYSEINAAQWRLLEEGKLTRAEVKVGRYRILFQEMGISCSPEKATAIYERFLGVGHYFIDGAEQLLTELYGKYSLFLASNGTLSVQKSRIASAGIERFFDAVFISQEIGADKPTAAFFDACFAKIPHLKRSETLIIGDSLTSDIRGGKNAGIVTVWFNPLSKDNHTDIFPDYTVHHLRDFPFLLRKLSSANM